MTTSLGILLVLGLVLLVGAFVQSAVGFGINIVSAPVVLLAAPQLMPGALILAGLVLPALQLAVEGFHIAWRPLSWNLGARALTTPLGVWLVLVLSPQQIGLALGVVILLTVVLSIWSLDVRPTIPNSLIAGALSGISSASTAAGGPFTALLFQHEAPQRMRSTLAVSFIVGGSMSAIGLASADRLDMGHLWAAVIWTPFMILGYAASARVRRRLAVAGMRRAVLTFCVVAAVIILAKAFVD